MAENLMNNPIVWTLLSAVTVTSLLWSIITYYKSNRKKELSCYFKTNKIIQAGKTLIPKLDLKYNGEEIEDLSITKIAIWSSGNELINKNDVVDKKPLTIKSASPETKILDGDIVSQSETINEFQIVEKNNTEIVIDFSYVEKADGVVIQVMHSGNLEDLNVEGKIKGGRIKGLNRKKRGIKDEKKRRIVYSLLSVVIIVWVWGLVAAAAWRCYVGNLDRVSDNLLFVFVLGYAIVVSVMYIRIIKRLLYMNVPSVFRREFLDEVGS